MMAGRHAACGLVRLVWACTVSVCLLLASCGPPVNRDYELSPEPLPGATVTAYGDGSELGQRVELRVPYDEPITVEEGFSIYNLKPNFVGAGVSDLRALECSAAVEDKTTLVLIFYPKEGSETLPLSQRFSFGSGLININARFGSGGLEYVYSASDSGINAFFGQLSFMVAPDLEFEAGEAVMGSKAEGVCATGSLRITHVPGLRLDAHIYLTKNAQLLVSSLDFTSWDNSDSGRSAYAAHVAETINAQYGDQFESWSEADTVYIQALEPHDGELIEPELVEKQPT